MQVILMKSLRKVGKVGEVVNVKNGYGRNFLFPQQIAIRATKENLDKIKTIQQELEEKSLQEMIKIENAAKSLEGKHLKFIVQSGTDGRLFGSVSSKLIASSVAKLINYQVNYSNIMLEKPIKVNGVFKVQVILHPKIPLSILIVVAKSELEAEDSLNKYKEENEKKSQENESEK